MKGMTISLATETKCDSKNLVWFILLTGCEKGGWNSSKFYIREHQHQQQDIFTRRQARRLFLVRQQLEKLKWQVEADPSGDLFLPSTSSVQCWLIKVDLRTLVTTSLGSRQVGAWPDPLMEPVTCLVGCRYHGKSFSQKRTAAHVAEVWRWEGNGTRSCPRWSAADRSHCILKKKWRRLQEDQRGRLHTCVCMGDQEHSPRG